MKLTHFLFSRVVSNKFVYIIDGLLPTTHPHHLEMIYVRFSKLNNFLIINSSKANNEQV